MKPEQVKTNVLVIVITKWSSWEARKYIRESFGRVKNGAHFNFTTIFLIGLEPQATRRFFPRLYKESREFKDLLVPNVEDNYHTVGMKLLSAFKARFTH